jgi:hypothetical protein
MLLLDKRVFTGIYDITTMILRDNFFYEPEALVNFMHTYTDTLANEYCLFEDNTDREFIRKLKTDLEGRKLFTSYFMSFHLHDALVNQLHFSDEELSLFESILPKFVGVYNAKQQGNQRACD